MRERRYAEASGGAAQNGQQHERAGDTTDELADDIGKRLANLHRAGGEHAHGDGGVEMPARYRAIGEGKSHDGQAVGEGNRGDAVKAGPVADHGRGAGTDEHESKSSDELGKEFWCNPIGHLFSPEMIFTVWSDQLRAKGRALVSESRRPGRRGRRPGKRAALLRGNHLRFEIDADRLRDTGAVFGIGPVAVGDLPLDDLDWHALHRCLVVLEQLLLLLDAHQPEQVAGLTIVVIAVAVIVAVSCARDRERRLAEALVL